MALLAWNCADTKRVRVRVAPKGRKGVGDVGPPLSLIGGMSADPWPEYTCRLFRSSSSSSSFFLQGSSAW